MNNFPKPQYGNNSVGFVYFQNSPTQASSSGTCETLDYIEFTNTPNTTTGFQPGFSSSPQQFRQRNSNYHRGNRNKNNYRQFHSDVNYQEFSPNNQNQGYSPRGNYSPRARGRGNFSNRGNYNSRGYYRNQNKNKKKLFNKHDIRKYVNRSMIENPWKKLMSTIKISTVTSGDSNTSEQLNATKSTNSEEEKLPTEHEADKNVTNPAESVAKSDTNSPTLDTPE